MSEFNEKRVVLRISPVCSAAHEWLGFCAGGGRMLNAYGPGPFYDLYAEPHAPSRIICHLSTTSLPPTPQAIHNCPQLRLVHEIALPGARQAGRVEPDSHLRPVLVGRRLQGQQQCLRQPPDVGAAHPAADDDLPEACGRGADDLAQRLHVVRRRTRPARREQAPEPAGFDVRQGLRGGRAAAAEDVVLERGELVSFVKRREEEEEGRKGT